MKTENEIINPFLAGIKKVEFALAETIKMEHKEKLSPGITIQVEGEFEKICIEGLASVETKQERDKSQDIYNTVLKFRCAKEVDKVYELAAILSCSDFVYRLTTVLGEQYLMGTNEKPFPTVTSVDVNPNAPVYARITEYEVTYVNTHSLLKIEDGEGGRGLTIDKLVL